MPQGPKYDPKYGALVKIVKDPKVYLLLGNNKHWITSETVFNALKYSWSWIEDVATDLLNKYTSAGEITYTNHHPNYTLIKYNDNPRVYRLEPDPENSNNQVKRYIPNETIFNSLNFRWDRIVTIDDTEIYTTGDDLTTAEGEQSVLGEKITSPSYFFISFLSLGFEGEEVKQLQIRLQQLGFFPQDIEPNGNFGETTETAVKAFQTANGLDPVGFVGPGTREMLNSL